MIVDPMEGDLIVVDLINVRTLLAFSAWCGILALLIGVILSPIFDFTWYKNIWFWGFAVFSMPAQTFMIARIVDDLTQLLLFPFELLNMEELEDDADDE